MHMTRRLLIALGLLAALATTAHAAVNLSVTNVTVTASNSVGVASGDYVTIAWAPTNTLSAAAAGTTNIPVYDNIYLSTSATLSGSAATLIGRVGRQVPITNEVVYSSSAVVRIPPALVPYGTYYVVVAVDADAANPWTGSGVVTESVETDNYSASSSFVLQPEVLPGGGVPASTDAAGHTLWRAAWSAYCIATNAGYAETTYLPLTTDSARTLDVKRAGAQAWLAANRTTISPWASLVLTNTSMTNIVIGSGSAYQLSTLIGTVTATNHTICGITNWSDGRRISLFIGDGQTNTFANASATETVAANRILTGTGANFIKTNAGCVTLRYSSARSRWIVESVSP